MQRFFPRRIDVLDEIFAFLQSYTEAEGLDPSVRTPIDLTVEELFTNLVKYNRGTTHDILIELHTVDEGVEVSLTDYDVEPFDPTASSDVDTEAPLAERTPGGLGLHLIRRLVDDIEYAYEDRESKITFRKTVRPTDVRD